MSKLLPGHLRPSIDLSTLRPAQEESVITLLPLLQDIPEAFAADPDGFSVVFWPDFLHKAAVEKYSVVSDGLKLVLACSSKGRSPLHWAVLAGFPQLAEELMHLPLGPLKAF